MKKFNLTYTLLFSILISITGIGQTNNKPVDYLSVPGPVNFDNTSFKLVWSSHPSAAYYKQEYLPQGQTVEQFKTMILLEVLTGEVKLADIVAAKVNELKSMKPANPYVSYELFEDKKTGEYILDFVITANAPDNKSIKIAERNVYRYKNLAGQKGIQLFAVSNRSYGAEAGKFVAAIPATKATLVDKVKSFTLPVVNVK